MVTRRRTTCDALWNGALPRNRQNSSLQADFEGATQIILRHMDDGLFPSVDLRFSVETILVTITLKNLHFKKIHFKLNGLI